MPSPDHDPWSHGDPGTDAVAAVAVADRAAAGDDREGRATDAVGRPRPTPVGRVHAARVAAATVGVFAVVALVIELVDAFPLPGEAGPAWTIAAFLLGVAVVPLFASPVEWFVHRFVYHQPVVAPLAPIFTVHTAHHYAFFPTWRYVTSGPPRRLAIRGRAPDVHHSPVRNAGVRLAHFAWYMTFGAVFLWLPAWLSTSNVALLAGLVVGSAIVSNLFIVVHDTIHRPGSHRIVEAQPWYAFLDRHHYIHHVDLGANLNFLLPLADWLFGSLRTSLTPDEQAGHGTLEEAKLRPVGQGGRARDEVAVGAG